MTTDYIKMLLESKNEALSLGETLIYDKARQYYIKDVDGITISPIDLMGILNELSNLRIKIREGLDNG